jgi:hypothetical protein
MTARADAVDIDSAPDKTVPWGADWDFDKPKVNVDISLCGTGDVDVDVVYTITNSLCGRSYQAIRKWEAKDTCGNKDSCKQIVTVLDAGAPVIVSSPNKTVECGAAWSFDPPTAFDSADGTPLVATLISTTTNGAGRLFSATCTWETADACGHAARCAQIVTVQDSTPPLIVLVPNRTVELGAAWGFDEPVALDTCSGPVAGISVIGTVTNLIRGSTFSATRSWHAADAAGNTAAASQMVLVLDTTSPTLVMPPDFRARAGTAWVFGIPTASDAGGAVTLTVDGTTTNRTCGGSFIARRSWRATDLSGNSVLGVQTVTVADDEPPVMSCAPSKTVEAGVAWSFNAPSALDTGEGGSVPILLLSTVTNYPAPGAVKVTRTWRATDGCGNSAECSQSVSIVDTVAPTLVSPPDLRVRLGTPWSFGTPVGSDAGGAVTITVAQTVTNLTCGRSFVARRTWRGTDLSGNTALCSQSVVVADDQPPTLNCGAAKSVEAGSAWTFDAPVGFDAGDNANVPVKILATTTNNATAGVVIVIRSWSATDVCGNSAQCSQAVTIVDTAPPALASVPAAGVYRCLADVPPPAVIDAFDVSDGLIPSTCVTTTNGFCPSFVVHTWTASDRHGNTATVSQTNTVFIPPPRIISEPTDRTVCSGERVQLCLELADVCAATYEWSRNGQPLPNANSSCLVLDSVSASDAGAYCVRVSGSFCPAGEPQLIRCATLTVRPVPPAAPLIDITSRAGEIATFRATTDGALVSGVWRHNGVLIPGEDGYTLTVRGVTVADAGVYSVELISPCGSSMQGGTLTVLETPVVNTAPFISAVADRVLQHNESTGRIPFTIGDAESSPAALVVSAISSEPMLVPTENIILGGAGSDRTVMVVAPSAGRGPVTITLVVSDGRNTSSASFNISIAPYVPVRSRLGICIHGNGVVAPDLNGQELIVGETYSVRAIHGAGQMFTGWTGEVSGAAPLLTFVMSSNLMLNAGFELNPFLTQAGNYNGLFHESDEVRHETSGFLTLTRNVRGKYSGTLISGKSRLRFTGQFDALGNATNLVRRGKVVAFIAELHLGAGDRPDEIEGRIRGGTWVASVVADRASFHAVTNRASFAGRYTIVIPGAPADQGLPVGDGFGTVVVGQGGGVTFAGTLADGRKVAQRVPLARGGEWPLYVPLYSGGGSLLSWQTFANRPTQDVGGILSWTRPPLAHVANYPAGFSLDAAAAGSRYFKPAAGHRALDLAEAIVAFSDSHSMQFANSVTLRTDNKVVNQSDNVLHFGLNAGSGLFSGVVMNPVTGARDTFKGALLQKQNRGAGFCSGTNGFGHVTFEAAR